MEDYGDGVSEGNGILYIEQLGGDYFLNTQELDDALALKEEVGAVATGDKTPGPTYTVTFVYGEGSKVAYENLKTYDEAEKMVNLNMGWFSTRQPGHTAPVKATITDDATKQVVAEITPSPLSDIAVAVGSRRNAMLALGGTGAAAVVVGGLIYWWWRSHRKGG